MTVRRIQVMGFVLALGFHATAVAQVVQEPSVGGVVTRRRCGPTQWPKRLPSLDALLDSAALLRAAAGIPAADTIGVLLSIQFRGGDPAKILVLQQFGPADVLDSLAQILQGTLKPVQPKQPLAAMRVHVRGGPDGPLATVERSIFCPPEPAVGGQPGQSYGRDRDGAW